MSKGRCGAKGCDNPLFSDAKRYCLTCHAAYMRNWRRTHPITPEQRWKDSVRSMAGVYKRRGKLEPLPCRLCGTETNVEMHHPDYDYPLIVDWLCRPCHLAGHEAYREVESLKL